MYGERYLLSWVDFNHFPDLGCVIGRACRKLLDVGREEDSGDVLLMRREVCHRKELSMLVVLNECPDKDVALKIQ